MKFFYLLFFSFISLAKSDENKIDEDNNRKTKQIWPIFSSSSFLFGNPPEMETIMGLRRLSQRLPIVTGRGLSKEPDPVSFTVEETPGKSTLNSSRVRSIVDIQNQAEFKVARANDDEMDLFEGMESLETVPSPRHYGSGDLVDEIILPGSRPVGYVNKQAKPNDCCLFIFLDGSAFYFDDFLRKLTGYYRLMYGTVNNHPHYVSRNCKTPEEYNGSCTYIWYSGYGWVVGVGRYIGQTKGVIYTRQEETCPSGLSGWRYLNEDLEWKDNGNIYMDCAT